MLKHTDEEIIDFVNNLYDDTYPGSKSTREFAIDIKKNTDKEVLFEVHQMYDCPELNFSIYKKYSEFFGTDNIDKYDDISESGCESCDYGSKYGYAIRVWK